MKNDKFSEDQNRSQKLAGGSQLTAAEDLKRNETDFTPSPDEVARRAYFSYVNQGSSQGHEVQHWLEAEAQLLEERKLTRIHGFHHKSNNLHNQPMKTNHEHTHY
jgi:hypothetical protein